MDEQMGRQAGQTGPGGWQVNAAFAAGGRTEAAPWFYAVYEGGEFGHRERGLLAAMAWAHTDAGARTIGAREAAELVVRSFAEGYFCARRTFGAKRAASESLHAVNAWLFSQIRNDGGRGLAPVSLAALIFAGPGLGVISIGACRLYRSRHGAVAPLSAPHMRSAGDGLVTATRGVGLDRELSVDYAEEQAETGDRYLLLAGDADASAATVRAAFDLKVAAPEFPALAAMILDVAAAPMPDAAARDAVLAALPLRPEPRDGDTWDGYKIGRTIYRGRYTVLKFARDTVTERDVVLKIPLRAMLQDEVFTAGFMREAWIGSTVRSGNVASYMDLPPERRSSLYLVMPFYQGETLEARLNRQPLISLPEGAGIALKLCEAVQDLAVIQIIHRDLKPDNVMLLAHNEVKLLDLGLAYLPGIDMLDATKPGGTLRYMAPELLQGVQANARSEVYALGVTIYRMFAGGAYPFGQREGLPLKRLRPDLPSWLGTILQKCLQPEPAARFADAGEMAAALHAGLVNGMADGYRKRRFPGLTKLQIFQALTVLFGLGLLLMLVRAWR